MIHTMRGAGYVLRPAMTTPRHPTGQAVEALDKLGNDPTPSTGSGNEWQGMMMTDLAELEAPAERSSPRWARAR